MNPSTKFSIGFGFFYIWARKYVTQNTGGGRRIKTGHRHHSNNNIINLQKYSDKRDMDKGSKNRFYRYFLGIFRTL